MGKSRRVQGRGSPRGFIPGIASCPTCLRLSPSSPACLSCLGCNHCIAGCAFCSALTSPALIHGPRPCQCDSIEKERMGAWQVQLILVSRPSSRGQKTRSVERRHGLLLSTLACTFFELVQHLLDNGLSFHLSMVRGVSRRVQLRGVVEVRVVK